MSSVQRLNSENCIPNEQAKIKFDSLFIFYADDQPNYTPGRFLNMKFPPEKMFMHCKSGKRLDDLIKVMYEDGFDMTTVDGISRYDELTY